MIASAIALLAMPRSFPDIVCSARFFKPGTEKSYFHLYLCRFDGSHRRQLTFGRKLQMVPKWLDHDNLAYVELDRPPISDGSRTGIHHKARINVLNLKTNRIKTLVEVQGTDIYADYDSELDAISLGDLTYKVSAKRATKLPKVNQSDYKDPWSDEDNEGISWAILPSTTAIPRWKISRKATKSNWKAIGSGQEYNDVEVTVTSAASTSTYILHGSSVDEIVPIDQNRFYLVTNPEPSRVDNDHFVYEVNTKTHKSKLVLSRVGSIQLNAKAGYWIARQPEARPMVDIPGSGSEWAYFLYAGDLKSGKRWTLFDGLVNADDYSVRPK